MRVEILTGEVEENRYRFLAGFLQGAEYVLGKPEGVMNEYRQATRQR